MSRFTGLRPAALGIALALLLSACSTTSKGPEKPPAGIPQAQRPLAEEAPVLTPRMAAAADALTKMAAMQDRLYRVAAPLLIQNADLCKAQARNLLGFTAKNRYSYPNEYNEAAHVAFGMGDRLQVTGVLAGSGAAKAGLKRGDGLVSAGGKSLPMGANASTLAGAIFGPLVANQAALAMQIERDGSTRSLSVPVTRACGFAVELGNSDNINSYADGSRILVTRGMLRMADSDEELAFVMAKGMAHNILGHPGAQRQTSANGSIIDNLINIHPDTSLLIGSGGLKATPQELDAAADNMALYLLARAGYKIDGYPKFWKELAATYPATVLNGYVANHPATAFRVAAMEKSIAEIKAKQAGQRPLVP
jgi:hypothetical protein